MGGVEWHFWMSHNMFENTHDPSIRILIYLAHSIQHWILTSSSLKFLHANWIDFDTRHLLEHSWHTSSLFSSGFDSFSIALSNSVPKFWNIYHCCITREHNLIFLRKCFVWSIKKGKDLCNYSSEIWVAAHVITKMLCLCTFPPISTYLHMEPFTISKVART